mmetsp:Transcript_10035/g.19766  ORF Transcript_10035/g.19766 Transcript_10035/m.19766 type:complete len:291 (-) Transcript_10035:496-1368(-)
MSNTSIFVWLLSPIVFGTLVGLVIPGSEYIETAVLRQLSSVLGWTYLLAWGKSFYPQIVLNYQRKSIEGLSVDFQLLNFLGFACYSVYNCALFWDCAIRQEYFDIHGHPPAVHINDVVFALHGFVMTSIAFLQCFLYGSPRKSLSKMAVLFAATTCFVCGMLSLLLGLHVSWIGLDWMSLIYILSYIKVFITLIKYMPQIILNFRRQSTEGWSVIQVCLDAEGGIFSTAQQILDAIVTQHRSSITGNPAKMGLGLISLVFDAILMIQHWVLYPDNDADDNDTHPLLVVQS